MANMEEGDLASMFRDEPEDDQSTQNNKGSAGGSVPRTDETAGGTRGKTQDASMGSTTSRNPGDGESVQRGAKRRSDGDDEMDKKFSTIEDDGRDVSLVDRAGYCRMMRGCGKRYGDWNEDETTMQKEFDKSRHLSNMEMVRETLKCRTDLAEIYSPPRIVDHAKRTKMRGGFSLDFTVPEADGYIWDFDKLECRKRALNLIKKQRPYMIVGSPECTPFSALQDLGMRTPQGREKAIEARRRGEVHLEFCRDIYVLQMKAGRYFLHKHPLTATS